MQVDGDISASDAVYDQSRRDARRHRHGARDLRSGAAARSPRATAARASSTPGASACRPSSNAAFEHRRPDRRLRLQPARRLGHQHHRHRRRRPLARSGLHAGHRHPVHAHQQRHRPEPHRRLRRPGQNQTFTQGNVTFQISYTGGTDGNGRRPDRHRRHLHLERPRRRQGDWSTADNWVGDAVPTPGARLIFPSGAQRDLERQRPLGRLQRLRDRLPGLRLLDLRQRHRPVATGSSPPTRPARSLRARTPSSSSPRPRSRSPAARSSWKGPSPSRCTSPAPCTPPGPAPSPSAAPATTPSPTSRPTAPTWSWIRAAATPSGSRATSPTAPP